MILEFEPCVELCADSLDPGVCFRFCVSLFLFLKNKLKKKTKTNFFKVISKPNMGLTHNPEIKSHMLTNWASQVPQFILNF